MPRALGNALPGGTAEGYMEIIENKTFDQERALYGKRGVLLKNCRFAGPADGESALKECAGVQAENCVFELRYPLWHGAGVRLEHCELAPSCRAPLWYSRDIALRETALHGVKALRECRGARIEDCDIDSAEFGWFSQGVKLRGCTAAGEYFFLHGKDLDFQNMRFDGKYSFQYIENAAFANCTLKTKDAFWHCRNVTVRDSKIDGEYMAWYSDGLTLINCKIRGTQPFCYCKNLTLIGCELEGDLCFEKSDVQAQLRSPLASIKNPKSGIITLPYVQEIVLDDPEARGQIVQTRQP